MSVNSIFLYSWISSSCYPLYRHLFHLTFCFSVPAVLTLVQQFRQLMSTWRHTEKIYLFQLRDFSLGTGFPLVGGVSVQDISIDEEDVVQVGQCRVSTSFAWAVNAKLLILTTLERTPPSGRENSWVVRALMSKVCTLAHLIHQWGSILYPDELDFE